MEDDRGKCMLCGRTDSTRKMQKLVEGFPGEPPTGNILYICFRCSKSIKYEGMEDLT